jgi:hypothetical protein
MNLRTSLIDGYISILHGMNPDKEKDVLLTQQEIESHAMQMYYYLEALVNNAELQFPSTILKEIFELFFDLVVIFV